ncbi:MAG: cytochrome c biogenesis CcdA family protein [Candidatus Methylomirabilales bacterium]
MEPGVPLALLAGVLSFSSPCCLPLLPGYLGFVAGLPAGEAGSRRVLAGASLFVLGFAVVFTAMGASVSLLGGFLGEHRFIFARVSGFFMIAMGLAILLLGGLPFLSRELRTDLGRMRRGLGGAFPLGMAFAFGWTPCIGPVLAALYAYGGATGSLGKGVALFGFYSLGLGIPFIVSALLYGKAALSFLWLRKHGRLIERAGGAVLVLMGALLVTGGWNRLFQPILNWYARLGWPPI